MKPPSFEYFAPTSLSEVVDLISASDNARLLAGGQSLMAMLSMRYVFPDRVVDLNRTAELDYIRAEGDRVSIGAMTRQRTLERSSLIASQIPLIPKALRYVGHFQTRNRGTIGGSLCQLDPSAELPALAMAHDAIVEVTGPSGSRLIPFAEFPIMYMTPCLEPNEVLTAVHITPWSGRIASGFREFSRRHGDFAIAGAMVMIEANQRDVVERASITLFGVAEAPVRATQAESLLIGQRLDRDVICSAAELCIPLSVLNDTYASSDYRGHVAAAMTQRALADAKEEFGRSGLSNE